MVIEKYSWTILDDSTAIKHTDLSIFKNKGSVIPIEIRSFFEIDYMGPGDNRQISLIFEDETYSGRLERIQSATKITRIMWKDDLSKAINGSRPEALANQLYPDLQFIKISPCCYKMIFLKNNDLHEPMMDDSLNENQHGLAKRTKITLEMPRLYPIRCEEYKKCPSHYRDELMMEYLFGNKDYNELNQIVISNDDFKSGIRSKTILNHYGVNYHFKGIFKDLSPNEAMTLLPESSEYDEIKSIIANNIDYFSKKMVADKSTNEETNDVAIEEKQVVSQEDEKKVNDESTKDPSKVTYDDIEKMIIKHLEQFYGASCDSIEKMLKVIVNPNIKSYTHMIANGMLGNVSHSPEEFEELNILMKTIDCCNGVVKESIPLPFFDYNDLINEKWEDFQTFKQLSSRFLFMIFIVDEEGKCAEAVFKKAFFWSMSKKDLDETKNAWSMAKDSILKGDYVNLPRNGDNRVVHIKPQISNVRDKIIGPDGQQHLKKCFWLNNTYITDLVSKYL